ncbi:MAG TPA: DUF1566 domain-containing protein [Burkholderiaceae bacterium]|nr:DUF1566 domain-containing protein [Burkholderiaceae bacterium]HNB42879.1 DUF1566 domain-containing protein [Burkholderiaceae bacterium]HNC84770.1 DUF1566 domain-containing protein [Nitrospira sp.]HNG78551.1 DUF1566 domain-containing protein [Burkholderiaceae bacterium]
MVIAIAAVSLVSCGGGGGDEVTPTKIQSQPSDQTVTAGTALVRFSVQATGLDLTYQWQRSIDGGLTWADLSGANGASIELVSVDVRMNGYRYRVNVTGKNGKVQSSPVSLTVSPVPVAPSFIQDLTSPPEVNPGSDVVLSITAGGTNLTYLWQSSGDGGATWNDVPENNSPELVLQNVSLAANGRAYRVEIRNSIGSAVSSIAILKVKASSGTPQTDELPVITAHPQSVSVTEPTSAVFVASATGSPTPTVQWQLSTDGGVSYSSISGARALSFDTGATSISQNGWLYRAVFTNSVGSVASSGALVTVQRASVAPYVIKNPTAATVTVGQQAQFTVEFGGTPTPAIQWQVSTDGVGWSNVNGATSSSYLTPTLGLSDHGKRYRATAFNMVGAVNSNPALLSVNLILPAGFTKVSLNGQDLPEEASVWACVRQNSNGLMWEAHVSRGYSPNGAWIAHSCSWDSNQRCYYYSNLKNNNVWDAASVLVGFPSMCGRSNWRLPTMEEGEALLGDPAFGQPWGWENFYGAFQKKWFGTDDRVTRGWTSSVVNEYPMNNWLIDFYEGNLGLSLRTCCLFDYEQVSVRLVSQ